ncbi:MAG: 2-succinyl-5-enolpyruvyl-6-hydroxy-3-cyclohexene-1-carboxylic-acid synthase [Acidimicrobiales bacterium]|jgi:2-succinyl-5-enolpyruvyl-6-hydroxy-3-cyclohexene-1-carboxylate synthase
MTGPPLPQDVQAAFAVALVDEWVRAGVVDVVTCPGSRSTPLLIAVAEAAERGALRAYTVLDERSAGFFALGLGLASGAPAPVVTTSGTAAVELHPAIVEAHHAGVPMLAVTADRPAELQDWGAPQTVHQVGLYGDAVRWQSAPGVPEAEAAGTWRSLASRSVAEARGGPHRPGPVHLNLAFREPLLGSGEAFLSGHEGRAGGAPWHQVAWPHELQPPGDVVDLLAGAGERGLIVAGTGAGSPEAVWQLARATGWPVLASPPSGCRLPGAVAAADALLRTPLAAAWQPDVVLRLGAPWASRVVNEWLASLCCPQVLVDRWGTWAAPDHLPGDVVVASPEAVCREVARAVQSGRAGPWTARWAQAEEVAQAAIEAALAAEGTLSEPGVARWLLGAAPAGASVVVSSSMPVRDVESWSRPRAGVRVLANRGANGIDGVLSTALGVAAARAPGGVVALLGDLAFLYDASALLAGGRGWAGPDLDVVVIDNDGGGIFNFLTQAASQPSERFERMWGTPQGTDLAAVARAYGAEAEEVPDLGRLASVLGGAEPGQGVRVFIAKTDRVANVALHRRLYAAVEAAVSRLGP